jgi:hypothetical protein
MISSGERAVSCVIHAPDTRRAVIAVHTAFNFAEQRLSLFVRSCADPKSKVCLAMLTAETKSVLCACIGYRL